MIFVVLKFKIRFYCSGGLGWCKILVNFDMCGFGIVYCVYGVRVL